MAITLTLDLEDDTSANAPDGRWVAAAERVLDAFAETATRATIFIVGDAAKACPQLVRRVAEDGHEVALHGLHHVPLGESGPRRLQRELTEGRALLEDIAQRPVVGFRAPIFSLTPQTRWAVEEITAAGFTYSSSILPARNPLHGWAGLPEVPFRWSTGLLEFPCPVLGIGKARVPFLGGIYLRYVPPFAMRRALRSPSADAALWSYVHPYDIDAGAPVRRFPHANWPTSLVLHTRRRATLPRLRRIIELTGGAAPPLAELAHGLADRNLPVIDGNTE